MSEIRADNNRGDVALGYTPNISRSSLLNGPALKPNIFPNDVVNKNYPDKNYQFSWADYKDAEYIADLKDGGYKPVLEAEWVNNRWEWNVAPRDQQRWNEQRHLQRGEEFLWFRDEELWIEQQRKRLELGENQIEGLYSKGTEDGLRHGLSVEGEYAGKEINVQAPPRKKYNFQK